MKPTYTQRNALLPQLGFSSYSDYLASSLWAEIKDAVLDRDGGLCRLCGARTFIVHHIDYSEETLRGESFDGMVTICKACHHKIEFDKEKKRSLCQAQITYRKLCRKKEKKKKGVGRGGSWAQVLRKAKAAKNRNISNGTTSRCVCGNYRKKGKQMCKKCDPSRTPIRATTV